MALVLDAETNMAHSTVWCVVTEDTETDEVVRHVGKDTLQPLLDSASVVVMQNGVSFDKRVLKRVWDVDIDIRKIEDTLLMSKIHEPNREGGHSLEAWGRRFKKAGLMVFGKGTYEDHDAPLDEEKWTYCEQDVRLTRKLWEYLHEQMKKEGFGTECIYLESRVRDITDWQQDNGFRLDVQRATDLYVGLASKRIDIEAELHKVFPPIVHQRWSDKQKDAAGQPKRLKDRVEVFNVGSRQQIARRLQTLGAVFTKRTPTTDKGGGGNIIIDEAVLKPLAKSIPEAALCLEYLTLGKRASMVNSWLNAVQENGRVYHRVDTLGAVTSRMTHSNPNLAQVEKGVTMRGCWTVDDAHVLVGIDASGLELRCLAHYMQDAMYTALILDGDIHWYNASAAGFAEKGVERDEHNVILESQRDDAKTFIYAFLYGAGDALIGKIVGGTAKDGKRIKAKFLNSLPALEKLIDKVKKIANDKGHVPAFDGRRLRIRSEHAALNSLLQGMGAQIMKRALVIAYDELTASDIPFWLVAQVHDEFQVETTTEHGDTVGKTFAWAIEEAGKYYDCRCPMAGAYKIGKTWAETH